MNLRRTKIRPLALLLIVLIVQTASAQDQLQKYIEEGISNNIVLQQKEISLKKAMYSLKTARSYFFPSVNLEGDYTSGEGGRNISIPVGDMLNPVYSTLNQLTQSIRFPQLDNIKVNFFPYHFYDVKVRTSMPLLNTDLIINKNIRNDGVHLQQYEVDVYKRELVRDIKTAYYNYLSAISAVKIYRNALKVAQEGKRVNESLLKNGKGLPVYILRSESEIAGINSQIVETGNQVKSARRYFNFILNRDLDAPVDTTYNIRLKISEIDRILSAGFDISGREELKMLETEKRIDKSVLKMNRLHWVPKVNAFIDLGAQDRIWNFNSNSRYYLFGLQLRVPIFEAFRNNYMADAAELNVRNIQLNLDLTRKQIKLGQLSARDDLIAARQNYNTAGKNYEAAKSYERLIEKGYKEGANTFIETVDARSQLTRSALMLNINTNKVLSALASYEREIAANKIDY